MKGIVLLVFLVANLVSNLHCGNILFLQGVNSRLSVAWTNALTRNLVKRDHKVTLLNVFSDVQRNLPMNVTLVEVNLPIEMKSSRDDLQVLKRFIETEYFKDLLKSEEEKINLIICDKSVPVGILELLSAKYNDPPVIILDPNSIVNKHEISVFDHLLRMFKDLQENILNRWVKNPEINQIFKRAYPNCKTLEEIQQKTRLTLINGYPNLNSHASVPANTIPVGGLHLCEPESLTPDLQVIYARALKGVIYVDLGDFLHEVLLKKLLETFAELPNYTFLWKINGNQVEEIELPANVFLRREVSLKEVFGDNRTLLFMTVKEDFDLEEIIWFGVPVLVIHSNMEENEEVRSSWIFYNNY